MSQIWRFAALAALAALEFALCTPCAEARSPLLQEGKKTLFQRVVTHPGTRLFAGPEEGAAVLSPQLKTFSVRYVYARQGNRLEVGASSIKADGWIDSSSCTYWPQAITMIFTDRTGRAPVLFFRDHDSLVTTIQSSSIREAVQGYAKTLAGGAALPPDFPIVASEPQQTAVAEKNFYLMPVLGIDRQYSATAGLNLLEVASINPGITPGIRKHNANGDDRTALFKQQELSTGFAFVIDTSISMKPYIDETRRLVRALYDELEKSPHGDKMAFAVVAFRSDTERTKGLDYTAKVICDFKTVHERAELENALAKVHEATVSSHDFNEDSFAGVKEAADNLSWKKYGSRVMLLISDAGPLSDGDSATGLNPKALADYLRTNKIYLTAVHIKSPSGTKNHKYAEQNYKTLTMQSDNQASYIALNASTSTKGTAAFKNTAKILGQKYAEVIEATAQGKLLSVPEQQNLRSDKAQLSPEDEARRIAASTGYAMQLQFLGNAREVTAPQVVKAWIADADLENIETYGKAPILAAEPAVLLTKNQLSSLYEHLNIIFKGSEEAFLNGNEDFFKQIQSAAAQLSSDPQKFASAKNLVAGSALDEILNGLPYKSEITGLTQSDWENMSTGQRQAFIRRLKSLIARYKAYDADPNWESFGSTNPGDWVYRVPLSMLP